MAKRSTINVAELVKEFNDVLRWTNDDPMVQGPVYRRGIMTVLEHMLHKAGNYKGFKYSSICMPRKSRVVRSLVYVPATMSKSSSPIQTTLELNILSNCDRTNNERESQQDVC